MHQSNLVSSPTFIVFLWTLIVVQHLEGQNIASLIVIYNFFSFKVTSYVWTRYFPGIALFSFYPTWSNSVVYIFISLFFLYAVDIENYFISYDRLSLLLDYIIAIILFPLAFFRYVMANTFSELLDEYECSNANFFCLPNTFLLNQCVS